VEEPREGDDMDNDVNGLWRELFSTEPPDNMVFSPSAIFAITRDRLMSRSFDFYVRAMKLAAERPRGAWEFERLWAYLWISSAATRL
jgi:hypothetical protein